MRMLRPRILGTHAAEASIAHLVRKEPRHDDIIVAADDARDILRRLALAQLDGVGPKVDSMAA